MAKGKRRSNNEGSLFKRKDGLWCAVVTTGYDPSTGKPNRDYYYSKDRSEVIEKRDEALKSVRDGIYVKPTKDTVGEWLDTWLQEYVAPSTRPKTWAGYESNVRVHLKPALGHIQLRALQTVHVQKMLNEKLAAGLSARTIELILVTLKSALKQALVENLITRNAAEHVKKPRKVKKDIRVLTVDEMSRLMDAAKADRMGPVFITMLGTGLRISEVVALTWLDVDLTSGVLHVRRGAVRSRTPESSTSKMIVQDPKTRSGKRRIPMPENVVITLKQWKAVQAQEKLLLGTAYADSGRLFTTPTGTPLEARNAARKLEQLAKKAEIDHVNPHALRHTYATRLLEAGVHPKVVQELLGHSTITLTLDTYSHVMPEIKQAAAMALDEIMNPTKKKKPLTQ